MYIYIYIYIHTYIYIIHIYIYIYIYIYIFNSTVFSLLHEKMFETDEKNSCIFGESIIL